MDNSLYILTSTYIILQLCVHIMIIGKILKMQVTNKEIDRKRVLDTREDFP